MSRLSNNYNNNKNSITKTGGIKTNKLSVFEHDLKTDFVWRSSLTSLKKNCKKKG